MQLQLKEGRVTWKQGWAEISDKRCYFRSRWEYRYALYLDKKIENFKLKNKVK